MIQFDLKFQIFAQHYWWCVTGIGSSLVFGIQYVNQILQRSEFLLVDKAELLNEEDEMFERRVKMSFFVEPLHVVAVLVIDVCVHAEKTLQYRLRYGQKVPRKRNAWRTHKKAFTKVERDTKSYKIMFSKAQ